MMNMKKLDSECISLDVAAAADGKPPLFLPWKRSPTSSYPYLVYRSLERPAVCRHLAAVSQFHYRNRNDCCRNDSLRKAYLG